MKLEIDRCPTCHKPPAWISEWMATRYEIEQDPDDGSFDYTGNHDDGSFATKLDRDRRGRVEVTCDQEHSWRTRLLRLTKSRSATSA